MAANFTTSALLVGRAGLEPAEPLGTRFTVWSATCYGIPTHVVPLVIPTALAQQKGLEPSTPNRSTRFPSEPTTIITLLRVLPAVTIFTLFHQRRPHRKPGEPGNALRTFLWR